MRGNAGQTRVHFKGNTEDFVVLVDSKETLQEWKKDKSIPLAQVVDGWKIFVTHKYVPAIPADMDKGIVAHEEHRHGSQGVLDTASHGTLDDEFGTHKEEDVVEQILEKGTVMEQEVS